MVAATARTARIDKYADRVLEHGRRNHFGERIEDQMRKIYAH